MKSLSGILLIQHKIASSNDTVMIRLFTVKNPTVPIRCHILFIYFLFCDTYAFIIFQRFSINAQSCNAISFSVTARSFIASTFITWRYYLSQFKISHLIRLCLYQCSIHSRLDLCFHFRRDHMTYPQSPDSHNRPILLSE